MDEKEKAAEKHDDKIVTLTKEQLEHVELKIETAATGDLDMTLKALFPEAAVRLYPLNSSLYISGFVPKPDRISLAATSRFA